MSDNIFKVVFDSAVDEMIKDPLNESKLDQFIKLIDWLKDMGFDVNDMDNVSQPSTSGDTNGSSTSVANNGNECNVCYELPINCVLNMCGHLCMCYDCAVTQLGGSGECPICRAVIRDVVRIYWS